jgi:hypothetical protein
MVEAKEVAKRIAKIDFKVRVEVFELADDAPVRRTFLDAWPSIFLTEKKAPSPYLKAMVKDAIRVDVTKLQQPGKK